MDEQRSLTIRLGLSEGEPPTGVVTAEDGTSVPFAGWLELIHEIARLASGQPPDSAANAVSGTALDLAQEAIT